MVSTSKIDFIWQRELYGLLNSGKQFFALRGCRYAYTYVQMTLVVYVSVAQLVECGSPGYCEKVAGLTPAGAVYFTLDQLVS